MSERTLHLRLQRGFTDEEVGMFRAHCRIFIAHVNAIVAEWATLKRDGVVRYEFGEPRVSDDRTVLSLPISGAWTLGSRAMIENGSAWLLHRFMPSPVRELLEEGVTEEVDGRSVTTWRPATRVASF